MNSIDKIDNDNMTDAQKRYDLVSDIVNHQKRKNAVTQWKKDRDFYFNSQWEERESKDMQSIGQVDVVFNRIRRAFRNFIANITKGDPTVKFAPIDAIVANNPEFEEAVNGTINLWQALWMYCWRESKAKIRQRRAISNQLISGLGYLGVYLDPKKDFGRGEVLFRNAFPWEIIVDLSCSEPDFLDSPFMAYRTIKTVNDVIDIIKKKKLPNEQELIDKIKQSSFIAKDDEDLDTSMRGPDMDTRDNTSIDPGEASYLYKESVIDWLEYEELIDIEVAVHKIRNPFRQIEEHVFTENDEEFDIGNYVLQEGYEYIDTLNGVDQRCKLIIQAGREVEIEEELLPIRGYRWSPYICEDTENPLPVGEVYFARPLNKLLNKMFSLIVYSAQTIGASAKLIGMHGAFGKDASAVKAFQNNWALPQATVQLEKGRSGESINDLLKVVPPPGMPPALTGIMQTIMQEMNDEMGYHPAQSGVFSDMPRTATATSDILSKSDINVEIPVQNIEVALQTVANRWLEYCVAHYDYEKPFSLRGHDYDVKTFVLNSSSDDSIINNISYFKWNIFTDVGLSLQNVRNAMLTMFKELVQVNPIFVKLFLKYSDLPDRFDIIREVDYVDQLEQQQAQMVDELSELQRQVYTLSVAVDDTEKKVELAKFSGQLQNVLTKLRAEGKIQKAKVDQTLEDIAKNAEIPGGK